MLEITPDPAFSAWFEGLDEPLAVEVSTSLEVVAKVGAALAPTRVRSLLLFYDGTQGEGVDLAPSDVVQDLLCWQAEALRCLESAAFRARLERLEPQTAARVLSAVDQLRAEIAAARRFLRVENVVQAEPRLRSMYEITPREGRVLEERFGVRSTEPSLASGIEKRLVSILGLAGLAPERVINSESGLRELSLETSPRVRVLLGLDSEGGRLIALLGEALDRSYYGDSVRFAERRFAHYLSSAKKTSASR